MSTGTTADFSCTRDKFIELAHKVIGVLEPGQTLDGDMLQDGIDMLGLIVRETDASGKWRWTIGASSHIPLAANTSVYTSSNGLPTTISELLTAFYRDINGNDWPLKILKAEAYEGIINKMDAGVPEAIYLTEDIDLSNRILYIWKTLTSVPAQSVVIGSDGGVYKCIRSHTAAAVNQPISGANWRLFWEFLLADAGGWGSSPWGSLWSPTPWISGTSYTSPDQIRLTWRRPLYDFDSASDTPDFPMQWPRLLLYKLAFDLGDIWGVPIAERQLMVQKAKGAFEDIFPSTKAKTNNLHAKAKFY